MKTNSQAGFIPIIIALIAALSLGGGVVAYKSNKHKKEALQKQEQLVKESVGQDKKLDENKNSEVKSPEKTGLRIRSDSDSYENEENDSEEDDDNETGVTQSPVVTPVKNPPTPSTTKTYTMADIKLHNTKNSCWTAVNGSVYDVTTWISQHPGGASAISGMCGVDGSSAFNGQHGGQSRPVSELASFKIGVLK